MRKGTPASKALPEKSKLTDGIFLDFCCHKRKCNFNHLLCKNGKHYTNWKNISKDDRPILLKHMEKTGLMCLDAETFKKHENVIAPEFAHLLGNTTGAKQKAAEKSTKTFLALHHPSLSYDGECVQVCMPPSQDFHKRRRFCILCKPNF